jgi:hypothetical protein
MKITEAFAELNAIRNDRSSEVDDLIKRVDAVGQWAAMQTKWTVNIGKVLSESHALIVRLKSNTQRSR